MLRTLFFLTSCKKRHNFSVAFIYVRMDALSFNLLAQDVSVRFRTERPKVLLCAFVAVCGIVLGIVAYNLAQYSWWGTNRCDYAYKLLYGGFFAMLLSYVLCAAVISFALCCSAWWNARWLCVVVAFAVSFYFGANCCAVCAYSGFLGVLYAVLLLLAEEAINLLTCFWVFSEFCCCGNLRQAFQCVKLPIFLQIASIFVKLFIIFALLRTLTALI